MTPPPTLILMDCQKEHLHSNDETVVAFNTAIAKRIRRLLVTSRNFGWRVIHCQYKSESPVVSIGPPPGAPIDGLQPLSSEAVFVRTALSAYSDPSFERVLANCLDGPCLIAGFSAQYSLLATIFDAAAREHKLTVIQDASACSPASEKSKESARDFVFELISQLTSTMSWDEVMDMWLKQQPAISLHNMGMRK